MMNNSEGEEERRW